MAIRILATLAEILYSISSFLIVVLVTPIALIICLPIYCFRFILSRYIVKAVPQLGLAEIVEARSTFMAMEDVYNSSESNLISTLIIEGKATTTMLTNMFQKVLKIQLEDGNGKQKYRNLTHYIVRWLGFFWWTPDKDFDLKNHIKYIGLSQEGKLREISEEDVVISRQTSCQELKEIKKLLMRKPYSPKSSPWELQIIPNVEYNDGKEGVHYSAMLLKSHHSIGDGYGLMKMIICDMCDQDKSTLKLPQVSKRSFLAKIILKFIISLTIPFDIMSMILWQPDKNLLHLPQSKLSGNNYFHLAESPKIPVEFVRRMRKHYGVQFQAVLFTACSGAIRRFMIKKGLTIPEKLTFMSPFPFPGHPDKMGNYWSLQALNFPVGTADPKTRLELIQKDLNQLKHSTRAITSFSIQPLFGSLFYWMIKPLSQLQNPTGLISDLPGPDSTLVSSLFGFTLADVSFIGGFPPGSVGILLFSLSYSGNWKMNALVDHGIISTDEELDEFMQYFSTELEYLYVEAQV